MTFSRRSFGMMLGASVIATATGCVQSNSQAGIIATEPLTNVGLQLYTIRESFQPDPLGALKAVKAAGYSEVEFGGGGYFDRAPSQLKDYLDEAGLTAPSMHIGASELANRMDDVIAMAKGVGASTVVLPWISEDMRASPETWVSVADLCTHSAQRLSEEGLSFAYHNHEFEFDELESGATGYDLLTENTDPSLVQLELDFFWAVKAGQSLDTLIDRHAGRIKLCHVKDMDQNGDMRLPGEGVIDFQSVFLKARKAGLKHFFVENDQLLTADTDRLKAASTHLLGMQIS